MEPPTADHRRRSAPLARRWIVDLTTAQPIAWPSTVSTRDENLTIRQSRCAVVHARDSQCAGVDPFGPSWVVQLGRCQRHPTPRSAANHESLPGLQRHGIVVSPALIHGCRGRPLTPGRCPLKKGEHSKKQRHSTNSFHAFTPVILRTMGDAIGRASARIRFRPLAMVHGVTSHSFCRAARSSISRLSEAARGAFEMGT